MQSYSTFHCRNPEDAAFPTKSRIFDVIRESNEAVLKEVAEPILIKA